jgi:hypothetical protein
VAEAEEGAGSLMSLHDAHGWPDPGQPQSASSVQRREVPDDETVEHSETWSANRAGAMVLELRSERPQRARLFPATEAGAVAGNWRPMGGELAGVPAEPSGEVPAAVSGVELRPVPDWPTYFAGDDGHIYSTRGPRGELRRKISTKSTRGYLMVGLTISGRPRVMRPVHRLIAEAFFGPKPSPKHQMRHLDGVPENNRPENLCWGTSLENHQDQLRHGTRLHGENATPAKLTETQVASIREALATGTSAKRLAEMHGVWSSTIHRIARGETWRGEVRRIGGA